MTITEIAEICGVSKKTVSRVINNEKYVSSDTRERVLKVVNEYQYRPNMFARNLSKKATKSLLISIHKTRNMANTIWIDRLINELIDQAYINEYRIIVEPYFDNFNPKWSALTEGGMIDGVVFFYEQKDDPRIRLARNFGIPFVVYGKSLTNAPFVSSDNYGAMITAYKYLFSRSLTRSILILGKQVGSNIDRADGAVRAYKDNKIDPEKLIIVWNIDSSEDVAEYVESVLTRNSLPDVFFVSGDQKALGVYKTILNHGLHIPEDVSVIGFDDIPFSRYLTPSLTTVAQDFKTLAEEIIRRLSQFIHKQRSAESVLIPTSLIIRSSTS